MSESASARRLAHIVYFKLRDGSPAAIEKMLADCQRYLSGHAGTEYFGVGVLAPEFTREVNVRDFDIALHVVFTNKAAHDQYQTDPRHVQFITENKPNWERVRVYDSYLA